MQTCDTSARDLRRLWPRDICNPVAETIPYLCIRKTHQIWINIIIKTTSASATGTTKSTIIVTATGTTTMTMTVSATPTTKTMVSTVTSITITTMRKKMATAVLSK